MKELIFKGVATALVTPLKNDEIDYGTLERLIDRQVEAGGGAVVIGGTTGESATLSDKERTELYRASSKMTRGRIKLILGTGSPDTKRAVKYTELAQELGADGALVVTPYYNKGTREGIFRHYKKIAEVGVPIILYNVPTRTGVSLDGELIERLSELPEVRGIKEAADSAERLAEISAFGGELPLYAGADALCYSCLSLGGFGVVSVVSNLYPKAMVDICKQFFAGERENALKIQHGLARVISSLFLDTNPAPIKYAMREAGLCTGEMRLPMWLPTERCQKKIDAAIAEFEANYPQYRTQGGT